MTNNEILVKWLPYMEELFTKWSVNEDCQQMIYVDFLTYDNKKLQELDETGQMRFWLVRFIKNYWFSKTSRYYYAYEKYYEHNEQMPEESDD